MKLILNVICAGCVLAGAVLAQSPVTLTVDTQSPGAAIPSDFLGLSFETGNLRSGGIGVNGYMFDSSNAQLVTLFRNLGIKSLRIGGISVDRRNEIIPQYTPTDQDIDALFRFARVAGLKVVFSLRLKNANLAQDVSIADYTWTHYSPFLTALAIGNEPNIYGSGDPIITGVASYLAKWNRFADAITNAVPGAIFGGPDSAGAALAQSPVTVTIDPRASGCAIPADFCGVSFGAVAELPNHGGVSGCLFSPTNTQLVTLFKNSGLRNLRLGGSTVDGLHAAIPSHADIASVFGFAQAAGVKVIYSLRLLNGSPADDAATARFIWNHFRSRLDCFAIGNEPDIKRYHYPPFGTGTDPAITNYSSYLAAWRRFAAAITNAVPGAKFAGPDAASRAWARLFARDEKRTGIVEMITQHYYVGGRPFVHGGARKISARAAIDNMLSPEWVTRKYPDMCRKTLFPVEGEGLPCRMTEADDYLKGVANASDAFASALWALDFLHWWAAHGCAGVNFHNTEWLKTDTVYFDPASRSYRINPKAYAIRMFDLGSQGRVKPVVMNNMDGLNLTAYAVGDATHLYVTLINKEHGVGARTAAVTIRLKDFSPRHAAVMSLSAPSGDAGATRGITLGGVSIANNAPWRGQWTPLPAITPGHSDVNVPAASAAVVKLLMKH